jgi:2-polyprenyl-3-methyl-5-hydroxy-6-metoxy-1,4-benzoquinol methylase
MDKYPKEATERFDNANFHINYCLLFIKKFLKGDVLEVGAGCGSFTRNYFNNKIKSLTLTEVDKNNLKTLKNKFKTISKIKINNKKLRDIKKKFDTIIYLHVLEHIKNDKHEIKVAIQKLKTHGNLIIIVPAHQKIYSNLDKAVGHYRRYDIKFFKKNFKSAKKINIKYLDSMGYFLYFLNKIFYKKEVYPSSLKIFIWDKFFTPITLILDYLSGYKIGKCILAIYKKN